MIYTSFSTNIPIFCLCILTSVGNEHQDCGNCHSGLCVSSGCTAVSSDGFKVCKAGWQNTATFCTQKCDVGTYGDQCSLLCGYCKETTCHHITGHCRYCQPGYQLGDNSTCKTECPAGFYGSNCRHRCGKCANEAPCDIRSGTCDSCKPFYQPPLCRDRCEAGRYGSLCQETCGECKENQPCDPISGRCQACQLGLQPPYCKNECPDGKYGENCEQNCGACARFACDKKTGHCAEGCEGTVLPPLCKAGCRQGFYGEECSTACGQCAYPPCDETTGVCRCHQDIINTNGTCNPCQPGYSPPLCKETPQASTQETSWLGLGLGLAAAVTFFLLVTAALLWKTRSRRLKSTDRRPSVKLHINVPEDLEAGGSSFGYSDDTSQPPSDLFRTVSDSVDPSVVSGPNSTGYGSSTAGSSGYEGNAYGSSAVGSSLHESSAVEGSSLYGSSGCGSSNAFEGSDFESNR